MSRERLVFKGMSKLVDGSDVVLLAFTDVDGKRQLTILCNDMEASDIALRLSSDERVKKKLPDVLWRLVKANAGEDWEITICGVREGQYDMMLSRHAFPVDALPLYAVDAVLLSVMANIPVFIDSKLMALQSVNVGRDGRIAIPLNVLSDDMLAAALEKAISEEDYEHASYLRDEQRRRVEERNGSE